MKLENITVRTINNADLINSLDSTYYGQTALNAIGERRYLRELKTRVINGYRPKRIDVVDALEASRGLRRALNQALDGRHPN